MTTATPPPSPRARYVDVPQEETQDDKLKPGAQDCVARVRQACKDFATQVQDLGLGASALLARLTPLRQERPDVEERAAAADRSQAKRRGLITASLQGDGKIYDIHADWLSDAQTPQERIDDALERILENPKVQSLWLGVEKMAGSIRVEAVAPQEAPTGAQCQYSASIMQTKKERVVKFENPRIEVANDLEYAALVRSILFELANLSLMERQHALTKQALEGSISQDRFIKATENLEYRAMGIERPITKELIRTGRVNTDADPQNDILLCTQLPKTAPLEVREELKRLCELHRAADAARWEALRSIGKTHQDQ